MTNSDAFEVFADGLDYANPALVAMGQTLARVLDAAEVASAGVASTAQQLRRIVADLAESESRNRAAAEFKELASWLDPPPFGS